MFASIVAILSDPQKRRGPMFLIMWIAWMIVGEWTRKGCLASKLGELPLVVCMFLKHKTHEIPVVLSCHFLSFCRESFLCLCPHAESGTWKRILHGREHRLLHRVRIPRGTVRTLFMVFDGLCFGKLVSHVLSILPVGQSTWWLTHASLLVSLAFQTYRSAPGTP